jgi:spore coat protein H
MRKLLQGIILVFLWSGTGYAQPVNPGEDKVFRPAEVTWIFLTMAPADKAFLQDPANAASEDYKPANLRFKNSQMDTTLTLPVGVRLRGNTSRYAEKKSFKIDFREFGGKKFFNYKKINLKANVNDPSLIREALTLEQYRLLGVPAARTHHAKLYINEEYMGVYLDVEQVDDVFLSMRFGHSEGFLYKCSWGANLSNTTQVADEALFESEINKSLDTRAELSHFVQVLNEASDEEFVTEIEKVFEVDRFLRQLAVEALSGHWDGYSYNQNNFYLYYNGQSGKVEFFPYDVDNTWGIDWVGQDWGSYDLNHWVAPGQPRPLTNRILAVPAYRDAYEGYIRELTETTFTHSFVDPWISSYQAMLQFPVYQDTYFIRAFGFTYDDFMKSFTNKMFNHVEYGLKPYLDARTKFAREQMPGVVTGLNEKNTELEVYPNPASTPAFFFTSTGEIEMAVYHSSGKEVPVRVREIEPNTFEALLPDHSVPGLYLIRTAQGTRKWILR